MLLQCSYVMEFVLVSVQMLLVCVDYTEQAPLTRWEMGSGLLVLLIDLANGNPLTSMNL
jgi:hypothetical protein